MLVPHDTQVEGPDPHNLIGGEQPMHRLSVLVHHAAAASQVKTVRLPIEKLKIRVALADAGIIEMNADSLGTADEREWVIYDE